LLLHWQWKHVAIANDMPTLFSKKRNEFSLSLDDMHGNNENSGSTRDIPTSKATSDIPVGTKSGKTPFNHGTTTYTYKLSVVRVVSQPGLTFSQYGFSACM
jgi:hypothetical protein